MQHYNLKSIDLFGVHNFQTISTMKEKLKGVLMKFHDSDIVYNVQNHQWPHISSPWSLLYYGLNEKTHNRCYSIRNNSISSGGQNWSLWKKKKKSIKETAENSVKICYDGIHNFLSCAVSTEILRAAFTFRYDTLHRGFKSISKWRKLQVS